VNIVRAFEDGDYVFAHTEYDFATRRIGFEVFRFANGQAVEHWDNIQPRLGPNPSGRSMVDGPVEVADTHLTETNRARVRSFVETVLIGGALDALEDYVHPTHYAEHNPGLADGAASLKAALAPAADGARHIAYEQTHRILAEGNFVLCASEGYLGGAHSAFYDLFRLEQNMLVEHWDTTEKVAPRHEWKNDNGKF
jgi:predicted SnoaL-like aldol condensation-catalyzing enzyme